MAESKLIRRFKDLDKAESEAANGLCTLFIQILKRAGMKNRKGDVEPLTAADFNNYLEKWKNDLIENKGVARERAIAQKGQITKSAHSPSLTWGNFWSLIQVLSASGRWKDIRIQAVFEPVDDEKDQPFTCGISLSINGGQSALSSDYAPDLNVSHLFPGLGMIPNKIYLASGFDNDDFLNRTVQYNGKEQAVARSDMFDDYYIKDDHIYNRSDDRVSSLWTMVRYVGGK